MDDAFASVTRVAQGAADTADGALDTLKDDVVGFGNRTIAKYKGNSQEISHDVYVVGASVCLGGGGRVRASARGLQRAAPCCVLGGGAGRGRGGAGRVTSQPASAWAGRRPCARTRAI